MTSPPKIRFTSSPFSQPTSSSLSQRKHVYQSSEYQSKVENCFLDFEFSDVQFVVHAPSTDIQARVLFYGSRSLLAQWSRVLRAKLRNKPSEETHIVIEVKSEYAAFRKFLEFIHFGKVELTTETINHVLKLAQQFEVSELEVFCNNFLHGMSSAQSISFQRSSMDLLSMLPFDMITTIIHFLNPKAIFALMSVNRRMYNFFKSRDELWKSLYSTIFGTPPLPMEPETTWKSQFEITTRSQFIWNLSGVGLRIQPDGREVYREVSDAVALGNLEIDASKNAIYEWTLLIDGLRDYVYLGIADKGIFDRMSCSVNNRLSSKSTWVYKYTGTIMHEDTDRRISSEWKNNDVIGVRLNTLTRTLVFFRNRVQLSGFVEIPKTKVYFPLVSIGNSKVRVKITSPYEGMKTEIIEGNNESFDVLME